MSEIGKWTENTGIEPKMSKGQTFDVVYGNGDTAKYTHGEYRHIWRFIKPYLDIVKYRIHPMPADVSEQDDLVNSHKALKEALEEIERMALTTKTSDEYGKGMEAGLDIAADMMKRAAPSIANNPKGEE